MHVTNALGTTKTCMMITTLLFIGLIHLKIGLKKVLEIGNTCAVMQSIKHQPDTNRNFCNTITATNHFVLYQRGRKDVPSWPDD